MDRVAVANQLLQAWFVEVLQRRSSRKHGQRPVAGASSGIIADVSATDQPSDADDAPLTLGASAAVTADTTGEASLAAAQAVAREHGVACDEAVRIAAGSNVLVHLKPAPVVARVMTGTAVLHDGVEQWLAREVAVGAFVAERSDLAVPPSDILPPGPHEQDGLWMTLWKFVPHDAQAPPPEPRELGRSLRRLHAALADFPGDLAPLSETRDWLKRLLAELAPSASLTRHDIDWLRFKLDALTPAVFESSLPAQALHGDASMSNLLSTESGLVWNDLEDVCAGPVAWDLAGLVTSARARGQNATYIEELLAAYGDPGVEDLEAFLEAHTLYEVVWHAFEGRRRPRAMKRAAASLALLRVNSAAAPREPGSVNRRPPEPGPARRNARP